MRRASRFYDQQAVRHYRQVREDAAALELKRQQDNETFRRALSSAAPSTPAPAQPLDAE